MLPLLSADEKKKAEARLAVFMNAKNSSQLIAKLPAEAQAEWGVAMQMAQALRRQKKDEEAWKILLAEPVATVTVKPDGWWQERRASAYAALKAGKPNLAYDLVRDPGSLSDNAGKDAAFLAGWLALRHLRDAKLALGHFQMLADTADGPSEQGARLLLAGPHASGAGRCREGDRRPSARPRSSSIRSTASSPAWSSIRRAATLKVEPPATPTSEEIARFNGLDAVRATVIARKAGLDHSVVRAFLNHLRNHLTAEAEVAMLAHLSQIARRSADGGAHRQERHRARTEPDLLRLSGAGACRPTSHCASRRSRPSSSASPDRKASSTRATLSGAGARGILQVMPITARHVCRDYKIKCDIPRLMKDPVYNTMMGSAYISDRMDEFSGSYVLTLAGYNAGPGRAREWIKEFGDPRDGSVDPIDWIHRIPFEETRDYVQKVLSNIQIYRARLGEEATAVRLKADLKRAVKAAGTAASDKKAASN